MTDFNAYIDQYCERTAQGLFNEPLNLFSNLAFIVAGMLLLKQQRSLSNTPPALIRALPWLTIAVGLGSGLFHSLANVWSMWADIIPIGIVVFSALIAIFSYIIKLGVVGTIAGMIGLVLVSAFFNTTVDPAAVNNSQGYFGVISMLFGLSIYCIVKGQSAGRWLLSASLVLALALTFRSVDMTVCDSFKYGSHFVWHTLNGLVLWLVVRALYEDSRWWLRS